MIFGHDFRENTETIGVAQTDPVEFNRGMPAYAIALWTIIAVGANNSLAGSGPTRYQQTLDSELVVDMTPDECRALFEFLYSRMGGIVPATSDLTWVFPLSHLSILAPQLDNGAPPEIGYPAGSDKVFRVQLSGTNTAGSMLLGWKKSPRPVTHSPYMVGRVISGLTANTADQQHLLTLKPLPTAGIIIKGFANFTRLRLYAADKEGMVQELFDAKTSQILAMLQLYNEQTITDPVFIPFDLPTVLPKGSYILFETGAGYAGTERLTPIQFVKE